MHNPESDLENETYKILWDFEIQTDHLISARRPYQVIVNKKREPAEEWISEKRDKYQELARELKKLRNSKVTVIPIVIGALGTLIEGLVKGLKDLEIRGEWRPSKLRHCWDRPEYWEESMRIE